MPHYLGIDIGTFESKGTLVDDTGRIVATAARPHKMLVPQPGWAEHDAETNWWGEFCSISKELIEHMNGSIGFDSEREKGARFWFELPMQEAG